MNSFRQLAFLTKTHGTITRGAFAVLAFGIVLLVSGRFVLARHAAGVWWSDRFMTGAHVVRWHLSQGWTGRYLTRTPEFEVSAVMQGRVRAVAMADLQNRVARNRTAAWGHSAQRDRFALLSFLARGVFETGKSDAYLTLANQMSADLCQTPAPAVQTVKPNRFTKDHARATLVALGDLFAGINTPWYLVSGTFLGAVREGDFLSHDYDIDVGINSEDLDAEALRAAVQDHPDFVLVNENPYIHQTAPQVYDIRPALFRVMHVSGVEVDVFIHHLDEGQRWHGSTRHRWTNDDFTLGDYTIADIAVRGPADADRYLTENYGNWRVPVTVFNCSTGTPNVQFNRNLFSVTLLLHAALRATSTYTDADAEIARMILVQDGYLTRTQTGWDFAIAWLDAPQT